MNREAEREKIIARLIANTRRKKRINNLVEIAHDIRLLEKDLGSLKAVSEIIGISNDMLRQFLSVEQLSPAVQKLVKERKIDLINIVHYMRNFDPKEQLAIAQKVIEGDLSAGDIRVLAPLKKQLPNLPIDQLISRIQKSRNIRIYIAYFFIPQKLENIDTLKKRFEKIIGKNGIVSLSVKGRVGTLELTPNGKKKIITVAREHNLSLRKFVDMLVLNKEFK